jgi:hypothetical protein
MFVENIFIRIIAIRKRRLIISEIVDMIKNDKTRMILLRTVHFEFVSSYLLDKFLKELPQNEIEFVLFESLKKKLFSNYSNLKKLTKRWKEDPKFLAQEKINKILHFLNNYFREESDPINQLEKLIEDNQQLHMKVEILKNPVIQKGELFLYLLNEDGILQHLKKTNRDSISFTCSSSNESSSHSLENLLNPENSAGFLSKDEEKSWISVTFKENKVILSGYLFRFFHDDAYSFHLKSWKLEGSNDENVWIIFMSN